MECPIGLFKEGDGRVCLSSEYYDLIGGSLEVLQSAVEGAGTGHATAEEAVQAAEQRKLKISMYSGRIARSGCCENCDHKEYCQIWEVHSGIIAPEAVRSPLLPQPGVMNETNSL